MNAQIFRARVLELFSYDPRSGKLFWKVAPSNRVKVGQEAGRIESNGYRRVRIDRNDYYAHRLIFLIENCYLPEYIDHKDGNPLNNRIENLREASRSENMRNTSKRSNNTSGIVGVCWGKSRNKWQAECTDRNGKRTHLGYFTDIQVAAEVVKAFRLQEHGEFAIDLREAA